jgi:hypothetical protein
MKRLARALLGPLIRPVRARIVFWANQGSDRRFENVETLVGSLREDVDGIERYVPALLNAIATQNAQSRANVRSEAELASLVHSVLARFQTLHDDLVAARRDRLDTAFEPKILRPERLETAEGEIRVLIGPGSAESDPGYVHVDASPLETTDVLASPDNLPFDPGSVAEVRAANLERFTISELAGTLLPHWVNLLAPGGSLVVKAPDADALVRDYVGGAVSFEELRDATFGGGAAERPLAMFDRASLTRLLTEAGLDDVVLRSDPTASRREIEAAGRKPVTTS